MTSVLLTGGVGFIGRNFLRWALESTDWTFVVLDRVDEAANYRDFANVVAHARGRVRCTWFDLKSQIVGTDFEHDRFNYIVHMAAASHVERSVVHPLEFIADNVVGTAHLLEWARRTQGPDYKLLYFSTDEVYGPASDVEFDEFSPHCPNNPYAASKAAAEALIPAWANTYGMPLVVTHCTNVYGPGQCPEKFIPLAIEKIRAGAVLQIHTRNGVPCSRYYVHVDDVSRAVHTVLTRGSVWGGEGTGKYNISGAAEYDMLSVAETIAEFLGLPLKYELVDFVPNRPRADSRYAISSAKLQALGWHPTVNLADGLRSIIDG